jgi:dinuclear metal center YbgI/SA1388 family protein
LKEEYPEWGRWLIQIITHTAFNIIMKLKDLTSYLDSAVPLSFQESYDNSGLQVGSPEKEISSAMISLDVTEEIIDEAIADKCDLVVSHHPLIFYGIKSLTGKSFTERIIFKAVKNDIAIYSAHTNLDIFKNGVSRKMAEKIGLEEITVLSHSQNKLLKLVTYIPKSHLEKVRNAIFEAGAGFIGNYDQCGFALNGTGSFRANANTKPFIGKKGKIHFEDEIRFETILFTHIREKVVKALLATHPYEEVAYDLYALENSNVEIGLGCVGKLAEPVSEDDFLQLVNSALGARGIRYSRLTGRMIWKVALCGGSGISLLNMAINSGADAYLTADIRYHDYFKTESKLLLVDAGHFETEKFSREILKDLIIKKFPKFAVRFSETNTNPINYF